ncbi:MAG: accessory factor UbiK family protein [Methylophilus sp.]|nr:accessory factor UbiK family protein [Methylophilus sp.]
MLNSVFFQDLSIKIKELIKNSPAGELDNNIHALIQGALTKMELISREEYDVQAEVLKHTREKLNALEKKLETLEDLLQKSHK